MQVFSNGGLQADSRVIHFYDTAGTHFWHKLIIYSTVLGKTPPFLSPCADLLFAFCPALSAQCWGLYETFLSTKYLKNAKFEPTRGKQSDL